MEIYARVAQESHPILIMTKHHTTDDDGGQCMRHGITYRVNTEEPDRVMGVSVYSDWCWLVERRSCGRSNPIPS